MMIPFEEAMETVLKHAFSTGTEVIPFEQSEGRVLAEAVVSDMNMPPFHKTAVDGFACRQADLGQELELVEVIRAGKPPEKTIAPGQCAKIMTGAAVPGGADYVFMVEQSEEGADGKVRFTGKPGRSNICELGEDAREGQEMLPKGKLIGPADIAVMAALGKSRIKVSRQVRVGILSTGDELVEPHDKPGISQIRNSNAYQLMSQCRRMHILPGYLGIARDNEDETRRLIELALEKNDVVLLTGGVSMGDFDFVPKIMEEVGIEILFSKVAVQPGKPTTYGLHQNTRVFGLPGNPVSAFMQFELMVKPLIYKMMESSWQPLDLVLPLGKDYRRRKADRMSWFPVQINAKGEVLPVEYHGSAHIFSLPFAHGISYIGIGETELKKGELVRVRQI